MAILEHLLFYFIMIVRSRDIIAISGGSIPQDSFTYHHVMVPPNLPSLVIIMLVNIACITTAVGFLAFNIYYRKNRYILRI